MSEHTERDTHFASFAKKVLEDLDEASGAFESSSEAVTNTMVYDKFVLIVARRAYDLTWHVLNEFIGVVTDEAMASIPDLTDPDESHNARCNCKRCAVPGRNSPGIIYSPEGVWLGDE